MRVDAERFERKYAVDPDPWGYDTSEYERDKYLATLEAMPAGPLGRVLEVGCSIGAFTELLAPRCERLLAIDFSPRAVARARERLGGTEGVEIRQAGFPEQAPEGEWDLIVCSEVLYYLDRAALETALSWLGSQLQRGASLLVVSWRGAGSEEPMRGDELHELLLGRFAEAHVLDRRTEGYRLDRFDGHAG